MLFMSYSSYQVPTGLTQTEFVVKKSRFICRLEPVTSRQQALETINQAKQDYPDARHHCWAYLIGNPQSTTETAAFDDGEPSGTAGKPILHVLQQRGIGDVVAIVIRYFGGIKLGAGGLTRAYGAATRQACDESTLIKKVPTTQVRIRCGYAEEPSIRRWFDENFDQNHARLCASEYSETVVLDYCYPEASRGALEQFLAAFENATILSRG